MSPTRLSRITPIALLGFALACDSGSDPEAVKQAIGSAVQDNLAGVKDQVAEVDKAVDELASAQTDLSEKVAANAAKLDQIATKLDELTAAPTPTPTPPPTPTVKPGRPDPSVTYKVEVGDAYTKGSDTALVTIVEWSDFQCPYCNRVTPTLDALVKKYGKDLRVAFKHNPLPFHDRAMPAAKAAEAAGKQGKFWEMHDKLFENNKDLTDGNFEVWAKELGLKTSTFKSDLASSDIEDKIKEQQTQGNTLGARGTPAFFVNGRFLSGAQPQANFEALIDEEMKKAEALVAAGTSRRDVYEKTIAGGATKPE